MKKIKVYWNNICLLRRAEENFINDYTSKSGVQFEVEYFGLGMPKKLRDQVTEDLKVDGQPNADVIVSTDLDIFQGKNSILNRLELFKKITGQLKIRQELVDTGSVYPLEQISTALVLPMVICVNEALCSVMHPKALKDLCKNEYKGKIVLGGADTAAGRSVVISLWYLYGEEYARKFLDNATFVQIPAMAFNACALKKEFPICILPSVLSGRGLKTIFPLDGTPSIPTFVCVKRDAPEEALGFLKNLLYEIPMQEFYSQRGFILPSHEDVKISSAIFDNDKLCRFIYPSYDFIKSFDIEKFGALMDSI